MTPRSALKRFRSMPPPRRAIAAEDFAPSYAGRTIAAKARPHFDAAAQKEITSCAPRCYY